MCGTKRSRSDVTIHLKGKVTCDRCGAVVRRDVLARHRATAKCLRGRVEDAPLPTRVTCQYCNTSVLKSVMARHLKSALCLQARGTDIE